MDASDKKFRGSFTTLSVFPEDAPDKPEFVVLDFVKGNCVAVNGKKLSPLGVMKTLNKIGGKHGVGRVDMVENRYVGMKSRVCMKRPAAPSCTSRTGKWKASRWTGRSCTCGTRSFRVTRAGVLRLLVRAGTVCVAGAGDESQKNVTGTVRVKLYKGNIMVAGRKSPVSLYNPHIATMEADPTKAYNQDDATGFIRLNALRLKVAAKVQRKK